VASPVISISLDTASIGAYATGAGVPVGISLNVLSAANGLATGCLCEVTPSTYTSVGSLAVPPKYGKIGVAVSITDALLTATGNQYAKCK
jgi:hypothetical protein